ncbi:MAG: Dihydrolipoyllysine-residue acetyltransferase component of pyruvate dehydrogenase complex [Candidatus Anoxychlamydiales bacterium]|nr:Dihydrolipoyllysine-residue acetyltransferase component of pyruvate dehydrogenase complex [Candidatus Anoxychlamydiales bacterium]
MTKDFEIKLPKLGESIVSATIVTIYKKEGDKISKDETLMEVATDKVNSEIPSPVEGTIKKILVKPNETIQVGDVLATVITESSEKDTSSQVQEEKYTADDLDEKTEKRSFFSPAVLRFAKENNVSIQDLEQMEGTGEGKRVTKKDIEIFLECQKGDKNFIKLSAIRQAIATNMTKANEVPTAYIVEEIDITGLIQLVNEKKHHFLEKYSAKLTITPFLIKAIAIAAKKLPLANSSFKKDKILLIDDINIGIAVNVNNDVLVPTIHNVIDLNFIDIVKNLNDLVKKAKKQTLIAKDSENGTITLTNFGMTNISVGFPIIKFPQACIIGAGAIKKKPWILDDEIKIRSIINISFGFDHRILDGIYACQFLNEIKKYLENEFDRSF